MISGSGFHKGLQRVQLGFKAGVLGLNNGMIRVY
jgi:hypothetical protein